MAGCRGGGVGGADKGESCGGYGERSEKEERESKGEEEEGVVKRH